MYNVISFERMDMPIVGDRPVKLVIIKQHECLRPFTATRDEFGRGG